VYGGKYPRGRRILVNVIWGKKYEKRKRKREKCKRKKKERAKRKRSVKKGTRNAK
jgi:hypothetical protein